MRILFVTKFLPLPSNSGGKQRSAAVLRMLAEIGDVTVCAIDDGDADLDALRELGAQVHALPRPTARDRLIGTARTASISAGRFSSAALGRALRDLSSRPIDQLVVAYSQMAPITAGVPARRRHLDLHNVESELMSSYGRGGVGPARLAARVESVALRRIERQALDSFDTVSVVSERDRDRLPAPRPDGVVCPNGWDPQAPLPTASEQTAVFVGLLGWAPNVDAATWFTRTVWPDVRARLPRAQLALVGRDPAPAVLALAGNGVEVTGTVPDVRPFLARARVALAPLRAGGGSRLKILEALAAGRPVVATSVGAEGLERLEGRGLLIVDDPRAFAEVVARLLADPEESARLGAAGNRAVIEDFAWRTTLAPMRAILSAREA